MPCRPCQRTTFLGSRRSRLGLLLLALLPGLSVEVYGQESGPPAFWIKWVRAEADRERAAIAADPKLATIVRGSPLAPPPHAPASGPETSTYDAFLAGEGAARIEKYLSGNLSGTESKYRGVIEGHILWQAIKVAKKKKQKKEALTATEERYLRYADEMKAKGKEVMIQAFQSGSLNRSALDILRPYAILVSELEWVGCPYMPYKLRLMDRDVPTPGDPVADFCLPRLATILNRPDFSPPDPFDRERPLRWTITEELLRLLDSYEPGSGVALVPKKEFLTPPAGADPAGYVKLSSFRGKKPVLLILGDPTDTYCCHGICLAKLEDIYRVFRDRVEIFWVADTVHDAQMPFRDFYGDYTAKVPDPAKLDWGARHPLDLDTRATTARSAYLSYPHLSIPCLLDNLGQTVRNSFGDMGGECEYWLIDINGVIAYRTKGPNNCAGWEYAQLHVGHLIRTDCLTRALMALLQNGGRYDPARSPKCDHVKIKDPAFDKVDKTGTGDLWFAGTIRSVSPGDKTVIVERDAMAPGEYPGLQMWSTLPRARAAGVNRLPELLATVESWTRSGAKRQMTLTASDQTYIALNGVAGTLSDLRPGDRLGVQVRPTEIKGTQAPAYVLRGYRLTLPTTGPETRKNP